jgi:uncharacterized protein YdiU (UPF0061 family)
MAIAPLDGLPFVHGYTSLGPEFCTAVSPEGLLEPRLLHLSRAGCELIGLDPDSVDPEQAAAWFAGGETLRGAKPTASVYSGHQFGLWAGQLGDGRALSLGELPGADGELWDVQLKGSGRTPFSRGGDGRAVLRSTLREYLAGEALEGLGIPTTRALAVFTSAEPVEREETETGALLVRLARCHVRFGTFEHFHAAQREDLLRVLFGYTQRRWYPHLSEHSGRGLALLEDVAARTGRLIAAWMAVGFCHGVMNTDNFSILGETIDYGPFGFLDDFAWDHICNSSDHEGRYAFGRQPEVAAWNLLRLSEATSCLVPGTDTEELGQRLVEAFGSAFEKEYRERMAAKLGLVGGVQGIDELTQRTLGLVAGASADHTVFWRELSLTADGPEPGEKLLGLLGSAEASVSWWRDYRAQRHAHAVGGSWAASAVAMLAVNPKFVARNHLLQAVIAAEGDLDRQRAMIDELLTVLARPCDEHPGLEHLARPPLGAERCQSVSCSS